MLKKTHFQVRKILKDIRRFLTNRPRKTMFLRVKPGIRRVLYFIRHGQTDANLNRINAGGESDIPLNSNGMAQARAFSAANQAMIESLDSVFVSPMIRARQTAELILGKHDKPMTIIENLREWMLGGWSNLSYDETQDLFTGQRQPPGGETREQFQARSIRALQDASGRHPGRVLVVAHGGIWHSYASRIAHPVIHIDNCGSEEICRKTLERLSA